jgi:hypothetical protein
MLLDIISVTREPVFFESIRGTEVSEHFPSSVLEAAVCSHHMIEP